VQLAGLSVEEIEKIEKKEQRKKVRHAEANRASGITAKSPKP
jgi:hypothetical protein